jgi:hypothetical protein
VFVLSRADEIIVSPLFHALWMLCGLGTVVFAASIQQSRYNLGVMFASFIATAIWIGPNRIPELTWVAVLTGGIAVARLSKPAWMLPAALASGALAGVLAGLFQTQSIPRAASWLIPAVILVLTLVSARHLPDFAPRPMRDHALTGLAAWGLVLAAAPTISAGWKSARALNVVEKVNPNAAMPGWVALLGSACLAMGAVWAIFDSYRTKRRN